MCAAIISKLLTTLDTKEERVEVIKRIYRKLSQLPNTGIWRSGSSALVTHSSRNSPIKSSCANW